MTQPSRLPFLIATATHSCIRSCSSVPEVQAISAYLTAPISLASVLPMHNQRKIPTQLSLSEDE